MKTHPIIDYPYRWVPVLVVALVLVLAQVMIMSVYTGADYVPAVIDGIATIGWLMALGYLVWFVVGVVSIFQTEVITLVAGILIWIAGSFMVYDIVTRIAGIPYITFASTIPFRLLFGIPTWVAILLWYRLIVAKEDALNQELEKEGLVRSVAGKGFYVCEYNADYLKEKQLVLLEKRLNEVIEEAKQAGLAKEDFVEMVQALYEQ